MAQYQITERFSGEATVCEEGEIFQNLAVFGCTDDELNMYQGLQDAVVSQDWAKVEELTSALQLDVEAV